MTRMLCCLLALLAISHAATAEDSTGTLKKVKDAGAIMLGYREASPPFSYLDDAGRPIGFSIDLCLAIVKEVKAELGVADLKVGFVPVEVETRVSRLIAGDIDIECGSTTVTLSRQREVDFTLLTFVTGTELLLKADSNIVSVEDLKDQRVAVIPGTTTERVIADILAKAAVAATIVEVKDHDEGLAAVEGGAADAYASDGVILIGLAKGSKDPAALKITNATLSYEPYGLMVRRDDSAFRLVANRALNRLYRSGEIFGVFRRWFGPWQARPSELLKALYAVQSVPD